MTSLCCLHKCGSAPAALSVDISSTDNYCISSLRFAITYSNYQRSIAVFVLSVDYNSANGSYYFLLSSIFANINESRTSICKRCPRKNYNSNDNSSSNSSSCKIYGVTPSLLCSYTLGFNALLFCLLPILLISILNDSDITLKFRDKFSVPIAHKLLIVIIFVKRLRQIREIFTSPHAFFSHQLTEICCSVFGVNV